MRGANGAAGTVVVVDGATVVVVGAIVVGVGLGVTSLAPGNLND